VHERFAIVKKANLSTEALHIDWQHIAVFEREWCIDQSDSTIIGKRVAGNAQ